MFRLEWRQQLVVLGLVTLAVAAATAAGTMVVGATSQAGSEMGDAGGMVRLHASDPADGRAQIAQARKRFGPIEVIPHLPVEVPGSAEPFDLRAQNPRGTFGHSTLALRAGRYPSKAGEIALTADTMAFLGAEVGRPVTLGGAQRTVVGRVENPIHLSEQFGLIARGDAARATSFTLLVGDPGIAPPGAGGRSETLVRGTNLVMIVEGPPSAGVATALVLVITTLGMVLVGLVAAAGFAVVAHRRQRQLGLVAAIGASDRHLRLVVVAHGTIVGAAAALAGAVLGVAAWMAAAPAVERAADHRIDRLAVPWGTVFGVMALAVVMATVAAWWPARAMARVPVMRALSGRPEAPRPVRRSLGVAVTMLVVGLGAISMARPTGDVRPMVLVAGIVATVVGVVFVSPAAVRGAAAPAGRLPISARIALRDLARYQGRAAAAVAAITLGLGISTSVVVVAKANEYRADEGNLGPNQVVLTDQQPKGASPVPSAAERARLEEDARRVAGAIHGSAVFTLQVPVNPDASDVADGPLAGGRVDLARKVGPHTWRGLGAAYVATPELLDRYGIDPSTIRPDTDLLTSRDGSVVLLDPSVRPDGAVTKVQRVALSDYSDAPTALVTQRAMQRHGWVATPVGWLVESPRALTGEQIAGVRAAAADAGLTIEVRSTQDGLATLRTVATGAGAMLALAIVAMTVGLIRGESSSELRTLTATGASPGARRGLTATTAGALTFVGGLLGTGGAYVALLAAYRADLGKLASPPVGPVLLLVVGLPLLAAAAGWTLGGREPSAFARQPLD